MSAPFTATKFDREYEGTRPICDEDCAEFLSGLRFDIPFPTPKSEEATISQLRDALQKAWIIFDGLRSYRDDAELLAILRSSQMEDAREAVRQAVRQAGMISTTCPAIGNHGDPRGGDDPKTELEDAMEFLDQAKRHVDEAESAVFRRDWPAYDLARTNLYELAGGMWE